ncbi:MAG: hypothetical protein ACLGGX_12250 [Bdellovibrionia bacterium]
MLKFKDLDSAFINSAYLSELWAVQDLLRFKQDHPLEWSSEREKQLQDEVKHAASLLDCLRKQRVEVEMDVSYSMQERLYSKYINLSLARTPEEHAILHEMTEGRAVWIYKTYLKLRPDSPYKGALLQILEDEKNHFHLDNLSSAGSDFLFKSLKAIDRMLFREVLPQKYGRKIFENQNFWEWYYS